MIFPWLLQAKIQISRQKLDKLERPFWEYPPQ